MIRLVLAAAIAALLGAAPASAAVAPPACTQAGAAGFVGRTAAGQQVFVCGYAAPLSPGFYIAPNGDDANPGTISAPFLTPAKCQATIRTASPKLCYFRAGTYAPPTGLVLTAADSGEIWSVYPPDGNGSATLSGAGLPANTAVIWTEPEAKGITVNGLRIAAGVYIPVYSQGNGATWTNNIFDGLGTNPWYGLDIWGDGLLIANNTIENFNGSSANGIFFQTAGVTNSSIRDNLIRCSSHYGIYVGPHSTGNLIARNVILGIGHVGGPPPTCGPVVDHSGTGISVANANGNLFVNNTIQDVEGYGIVINDGGGNWIDGNRLVSRSDPIITLNGAPDTVIAHNVALSPGSIGFNLGDEHDYCPRTNTSNGLRILNNVVGAAYEPIYLSSTRDSTIQGNIGNIGVAVVGPPSPHYAAGIAAVHWTKAAGCSPVQNTGANIIQLNRFTNATAPAAYGALFEAEQCGNTLAYNILWPYGAPGTAAIENQCGGSQTLLGNQVSSDASPLLAAPPIADTGGGDLVMPGQTVTLDASRSRLITGGSAGISYQWSQRSGPPVTIDHPTAIKASFTSPPVTKPTILSFDLVATTANGSTTDRVYFGVDPSLAP